MRSTAIVLAALLALGGAAWAGSASNPEISDERGDLASDFLLDPGSAEGEDQVPEDLRDLSDEQMRELGTTADLVAAWVHGETSDRFLLTIQVDDFIEHADASVPLVDLSAHFWTNDEAYRAVSQLSFPAEENASLQASFELRRDGRTLDALEGALNNQTDTVTFRIPKALVGNPGFGDKLTKFYVTSHFAADRVILDYAPGAIPFNGKSLDTLNPEVDPTATYGRTYDFGQFDGAVPPALEVSATPSSLNLQAGSQGKVSLLVKNSAPTEDTVDIVLGESPPGWDLRLEQTQLVLSSGQSKMATLFVTPPSGTSGQELLSVRVLSNLGGDEQRPISVSVTAPPPASDPGVGSQDQGSDGPATSTPSPSSDGPADEQAGDDQATEDENGAPAAPVLLVLGGIGTAAVAYRRRR